MNYSSNPKIGKIMNFKTRTSTNINTNQEKKERIKNYEKDDKISNLKLHSIYEKFWKIYNQLKNHKVLDVIKKNKELESEINISHLERKLIDMSYLKKKDFFLDYTNLIQDLLDIFEKGKH